MPLYDGEHFNPPAPVAEVVLRCPQTGTRVANVVMLLDTGADVTLVPRQAVERAGVQPLPDRQCELIGFDGSRSLSHVVVLDMILLGRAFRGSYVLIDQPRGVVGRDVLNHLSIAMKGPALEWTELSV